MQFANCISSYQISMSAQGLKEFVVIIPTVTIQLGHTVVTVGKDFNYQSQYQNLHWPLAVKVQIKQTNTEIILFSLFYIHFLIVLCVDIDECLSGVCGPYGTCYNTIGSFVCNCSKGFRADYKMSPICQGLYSTLQYSIKWTSLDCSYYC